MDSTVEQTNEKLKFENEINYLKYFRHIVRYSLYEENYNFSPENFYSFDISKKDRSDFLFLNDDSAKHITDDDGSFEEFFIKNRNKNIPFDKNNRSLTLKKKFNDSLTNASDFFNNLQGHKKQDLKYRLEEISAIKEKLQNNISKTKISEEDEKKYRVIEFNREMSEYLVLNDLLFFPYIYRIKNSNKYVAPFGILCSLEYTKYHEGGYVVIRFEDLPDANPYHLVPEKAEYRSVSNYIVIDNEKDWYKYIGENDPDKVLKHGRPHDLKSWNEIISYLLKRIESPIFKESELIEDKGLMVFYKATEKNDTLLQAYKYCINALEKHSKWISEPKIFKDYIKKYYPNKGLNESTSFNKLKEMLFNEENISFTGQMKFNATPNGELFGLNIEQRIFMYCMQNGYAPIEALNGPPGTGKTTVLQNFVATMLVNSILNGDTAKGYSVPIMFGMSFTNQAKDNIIEGFKLSKIDEHGYLEKHLGILSKRWIPSDIDYGSTLARPFQDESIKNEKDNKTSNLSEIIRKTSNKQWQEDAISYFINKWQVFLKTEPNPVITIIKELQGFSPKTLNLKDIDPEDKDLLTIKRVLIGTVKFIFNEYIKNAEKAKQELVTAIKNIRLARRRIDELNDKITKLKSVLEDAENGMNDIKKTNEKINLFISEFNKDIDENYSLWKKLIPFLQNEIDLKQRFLKLKEKYDTEIITAIEPSIFKLKPLKNFLYNLVDPKNPFHPLNKKFTELNAEIKSYTEQINKALNLIDEQKKNIEKYKLTEGNISLLFSNSLYFKPALDILKRKEYSEESELDIYNKISYVIDNFGKTALFHLSARAYECMFLIECKEAFNEIYFNEGQKIFKQSIKGVKKKYDLFSKITPCFVSTGHSIFNTLKYYFNSTNLPLFSYIDYLITDESGQISPELGAIGFLLAKRAIVVGDLYQLQPVYTMSGAVRDKAIYEIYCGKNKGDYDFEIQPFNCHSGSVMKIANNNSNFWEFPELERGLYLLEHRRCPVEIIELSNELIYKNKLKYPPKTNFSDLNNLILDNQKPWTFVGVEGNAKSESHSKINLEEAEAIGEWIKNNYDKIKRRGKFEDLVTILTPFSSQELTIKKELSKLESELESFKVKNIKIGTVHKMQGAEREIILISTVYDKKSAGKELNMIDGNKNLLNVMVSRAKQSIIVFGCRDIFAKSLPDTPTNILKKYLEIN